MKEISGYLFYIMVMLVCISCSKDPLDKDGNLSHQYVDLGLSVKWATCNVGADNPAEYGDYFAWGATEPWYKSGYSQSSNPVWKADKSGGYIWANAPFQTVNGFMLVDGNTLFTKYIGSTSSPWKDPSATDSDALKTVLDPEDDAAHVNWGGGWRTPTDEEFKELCNKNNCIWEWTRLHGVNGYKITSRISGYEGNFIFLPAAGSWNITGLHGVGHYGEYSSSSGRECYAFVLSFLTSKDLFCLFDSRYIGRPVRPVCQ